MHFNLETTKTNISVSKLLLAVLLFSFWPVWRWYFIRVTDSSEEPWCLCALLTIVAFILLKPSKSSSLQNLASSRWAQYATLPLLVAYIFSVFFCPNLLKACIAVITIGAFAIGFFDVGVKASGFFVLLLLSLPSIASLNFFAGYPLRFLVAAGSAALLTLTGICPTRQDGTILLLNQQPISVDAPCSGINMLWAGIYFAAVAITFCRLNFRSSLLVLSAAFASIIVANVFRVAGLSLIQVKLASTFANYSSFEPVLHIGAGVIVFIAVSSAILLLSLKLRNPNSGDLIVQDDARVDFDTVITADIKSRSASLRNGQIQITMASLMVLAAIAPLLQEHSMPALASSTPDWNQVMLHYSLHEIKDHARAQSTDFANGFPGVIKILSDGKREYIVRWVKNYTRQLHPSSDCFRASGYQIEFGPLVKADGASWSSFIAEKDKLRLKVRERTYDQNGHSYTDVSEWYWSACLGKTRGPWWSITAVEQI